MVNLKASKLSFLCAAVLIFVLFSMFIFSVSAADQEVAAARISEAESVMGKTYEAVLEAERVDADVSGLLVRLNDAAELLSEARMAFDGGDFDEAEVYAESTNALGYEVMGEAEALEVRAADAQLASSRMLLIVSIVGVSVVVIACVIGYIFFKRRYFGLGSKSNSRDERKIRFQNYRTVFQVVSLALVLLAASPALSLVVSLPSGEESFSEFWLLGPGKTAEGYPFNVSAAERYSVFVSVANQMGGSQYYRVYVKFGNTTQLDLDGSEPSSLRSLYEFGVFVRDEDVWESPVIFGFQNVSIVEELVSVDNVTVAVPIEDSVLSVQEVIVNGVVFPVNSSTSWYSEKDGFYFRLAFELWRYDLELRSFRFHDRVLGLRLNMTGY